MIKKEFPQGVSNLIQKLANNPTSRAFVPLADSYLRRNLLDEAIEVLTEGIQHHPTYVAARLMLGNVYQKAGRLAEAKRAFEEVVALHPENILAYKKLALIYKEAGHLGEAVEMCNKALIIDLNDKQIKRLLAVVQEEISDSEGRDDGYLPKLSFDMISSPSVTEDDDWLLPPLEREMADTDDSLESEWMPTAVVSPAVMPEPLPEEEVLLEEEPQVSMEASFGESMTDEALITNEESMADLVTNEEKEEMPLVFGEHTAYNRSSLYQIRLEEWLVSIQEKGVRR